MEYISKKLVVKGLKAKVFYWDDTALVGSPEAIAKAVEKIRLLSGETGLELRWKKCHLYGSPKVVSICKNTSPSLPEGINLHESFDMEYLKATVGSDVFVEEWLRVKLAKLEDIITSITQLPYKHEGYTLLRCCGAECRIMYLMRVLPPRQMERFMN